MYSSMVNRRRTGKNGVATSRGSFQTPCLVHDCFGRLLADVVVVLSCTESLNMLVEKA